MRFSFYAEKVRFLISFAWTGHWSLFWDEWNMTYEELEDAQSRVEEITQKIVKRLLDNC